MAVQLDIDITQLTPGLTKREFVRACGFSVGTKGRFKPEIIAVIDLAESKGYEFAKPVTAERVVAAVGQKEIDAEAFHEWELSKGYTESERRWPIARINEFVAENPDFKRRESVSTSRVAKNIERRELKPLPDYDAKAARKWAIEQGLEGVPERGRLPRWIAEKFIATHEDAGIEVPKAEPEANNFGPTPAQVNFAEKWVGTDLDGKKIVRGVRDVSADSNVSIGWSKLPVYAWSQVDSDKMIELEPQNA